jgi:hypothetical protein
MMPEKVMRIETFVMPRPEEIAAIEYQARQMRAQVVAGAFASLGRTIARLFARRAPEGVRA